MKKDLNFQIPTGKISIVLEFFLLEFGIRLKSGLIMSTKSYTVAVAGSTGLVGQKMIKLLAERQFPVGKLVPIASERSRGKTIEWQGQQIPVTVLDETVFEGVDIALFSAGGSISETYAPIAAAAGAVAIDNSSAWRMDSKVPLVVPEVNPQALAAHNGIIANPNCSTIQMVAVLHPLHQAFGIQRIVVSTYQAVTGSGQQAVTQLVQEIAEATVDEPAYPHQIAYNCLPHIDVFYEDGYTKEEHKMVNETRKIMGDDSLQITATCVRVPVFGGHSESVNLAFEKPVTPAAIRDALKGATGVVIQDQPSHNTYPMPLDAHERDEIFVGRIRQDTSIENGINMWIVSDNLRKGAATNSIQIAEALIDRGAL